MPEIPAGAGGDNADGPGGQLIGALLRAPAAAVATNLHDVFASEFPDLRLAHLAVFRHVDHPPSGSRLTELAKRAQMSKQAMLEVVDYLERRGYVERIPDPLDRRAKVIRMTRSGWSVHERASEVVGALQEAWARKLGEGKMRQLLALLTELNEVLGLNVRHG